MGRAGGLECPVCRSASDRSGNRHRFAIDLQADSSTQLFVWTPKSVQFLSFLGSAQSPDPNKIVEQWSYTGAAVPPAGGPTNARINLWLLVAIRLLMGRKSKLSCPRLNSFHKRPQNKTRGDSI